MSVLFLLYEIRAANEASGICPVTRTPKAEAMNFLCQSLLLKPLLLLLCKSLAQVSPTLVVQVSRSSLSRSCCEVSLALVVKSLALVVKSLALVVKSLSLLL
jgi:hypothetical protein